MTGKMRLVDRLRYERNERIDHALFLLDSDFHGIQLESRTPAVPVFVIVLPMREKRALDLRKGEPKHE